VGGDPVDDGRVVAAGGEDRGTLDDGSTGGVLTGQSRDKSSDFELVHRSQEARTIANQRARDGRLHRGTGEPKSERHGRNLLGLLVRSESPCSSRFPGDIFTQKSRKAVGYGHRNK
jgi:hypothetical protein